ncbi:MAG: S-layer homology domain-containing protein [Slackia sp.]|nr:S-layer homology domain-containing protein [Slackia sp.]
MTAYVNEDQKKEGAYGKAVKATLAATLAAGMVPAAAAFADEPAAETAEGNDVELLSVSAADAFSNGTVKFVDDKNSVEWSGNAFEPKVSSVTPQNGKAVNVSASDDYLVYYVTADAEGKPTTTKVDAPTEIGTYFVAVEAVDGNYKGGIAYGKFEITGKQFNKVTAFEVDEADATQTADVDFDYNAEALNVGFKNDKETFVAGKDYTVKFYTKGEDINNPSAGSDTVRNAGTYTAVLTGMGAYAGSTAKTDITVNALNLADAEIYTEQVVGATAQMPTAPTTVNGSKALAKEVKLVYPDVVGDAGKYTAYAQAATDGDANFIGAAEVEVVKVNKGASFFYGDAAMPETLDINLAEKEAFDAALIKVMDGEKALEGAQYEVAYTTADGKPAQVADLAKAGSYIVTVTVKADQTAYELGGSTQMAVNVTAGTVNCDTNLYVRYNGAVVDSIEADYSGTSVADAINVTLLGPDGKTELNRGDDYTVQYVDAEGNVVKAANLVNAGSYTMQIVSDKYQIENGTVDIVINPVEVLALKVNNLTAINGHKVLAKGTDPVLQYAVERNQNGELVFVNLSGSELEKVCDIVYTKDGVELEKFDNTVLGNYTVALKAKDVAEAVNYDFQAAPVEFVVDEQRAFMDVPADAWFHKYVMEANGLDYIAGYADGKFFGPNDNIKRGDVCVILARMGGVKLDIDNGGVFTAYETGFGDVDASSYYAQAIKWAAEAGVVQGYADGENFGPEDQVTREQFATMLYRYAEMSGTDVSADVDAELAKYSDGAAVTEFAREAIAWASEDGIMQGIGDTGVMAPQDNVTRAQVAKMAVTYQPAKLS